MNDVAPGLLANLVKKRLERPDVNTLAHVILEPINGLKGLSREIWTEYGAAEPGSNNRALLLRALVDIIKVASANNPLGDEFEKMAPEEFESGLREAIREFGITEVSGV